MALTCRVTGAVLMVLFAGSVLWPRPGISKNVIQPGASQPIKIKSESILFDRDKPRKTRFGKLEWLGTLRLTSPSPNFGGYSGLVLDKTGTRLLAISDKGLWLGARLTYRAGKMEKLSEGKVGILRGIDNNPLSRKFIADAESMVMEQPGSVTGTAYVSFERKHRIAVYPVTKNGFGTPRRHLALPSSARSVDQNKGIEGITILRAGPLKGALLAFTEEYLDDQGDHVGWLIGGPKPGMVTFKRRGGFAITDLASLPDGDVIVLERRFRVSEGVKMRLRRIRAKDIKAGAKLDGDVLLKTDDLREIDNMEALAVHRDGQGRNILTILSDNNFNTRFQRTLLMQFAIVE
jgi:hypothetical protein